MSRRREWTVDQCAPRSVLRTIATTQNDSGAFLGGKSCARRTNARSAGKYRLRLYMGIREMVQQNKADHQVAVPKEYKLEDLGESIVFENDHISNIVRNNQIWEGYLQDVFEKYVSAGKTVLEAGCYIGTHTVKLARLCAPGSLFAFEPHPSFHEVLSSNIQRNSLTNVQLFQQGLSDAHGNAKYAWITEGNFSASGLDNNPKGQLDGTARVRAMAENTIVTLTTIDSLRLSKLDFMKIDVEGYESKVLKGAMATLRHCKPIITLECWKSNRVEDYGEIEDLDNLDTDSPLRLLQTLGYSVQHISGPDFIAFPPKT